MDPSGANHSATRVLRRPLSSTACAAALRNRCGSARRAAPGRPTATGRAQTNAVFVHELPVVVGVDDCELVAELGDAAHGVHREPAVHPSFRCVREQADWRGVAALLEPFLDASGVSEDNGFQYLDEAGPIDWIVSRSRNW
jgi:hypothetical protein